MSLNDMPLVIGHRGAAGLAPENTLPSFRRAWALGVGAVELDVQLAGGELVVLHDDSVDRTTSGSGALADFSLDALRQLDAGGGAPVPLLDEVVAELPAGMGLNIELKGPGTAAPVARALHSDPLRAHQGEVLVSSFDHAQLHAFRRLDRVTPVAPLFGRWQAAAWDLAAELNAWSVNLSLRAATPARLDAARRQGQRVLVYTVNDLEAARRLMAAGASGVFTDYPDRINSAALS